VIKIFLFSYKALYSDAGHCYNLEFSSGKYVMHYVPATSSSLLLVIL
jgi:hypothetical protein